MSKLFKIDFQANVDQMFLGYLVSHQDERVFWKCTKDEKGVWEVRKGSVVTLTRVPGEVGDRLLESGVLVWRDKNKGKEAFLELTKEEFTDTNELHASGAFYLSMLDQQSRSKFEQDK